MPKTTRSTATSLSARSPTKRSKIVGQNHARYKSDLFESIHSSASDLHAVGTIGKQTMREYDELCRPPRELATRAIKRLREGLNMSQPIFARAPVARASRCAWP